MVAADLMPFVLLEDKPDGDCDNSSRREDVGRDGTTTAAAAAAKAPAA